MASDAPTAQTNPNGQVVQPSPQGPSGHTAGTGLMQTQAQNATHSHGQCPHTAPGSLANSALWFEGGDPRWEAAERTILTMRAAIEREAGENDTAELEQTAESPAMDVDALEASQAALEAHVAFVFAAYGVDASQ